MVIPSLLAHAATGQWCVTVEELHRLQLEYQQFSEFPAASVKARREPRPTRSRQGARAEWYDEDEPAIPTEPKLFTPAGSVAVIEINGVLGKNLDSYDQRYGGVDYDAICTRLDSAEADAGVHTILLHIRSPGGMALGAMECGDHIAALSKPTVAYTDFLMCSGGYWLGSQCDAVYSSSSAFLGSIGVLAAYLDVTKALDSIGFKVNAFSAGKWKLAGASFKPMTDEERGMFQARVERYYAQFTEVVNRKRELGEDVCQGQVFDGLQAVEAGLCDGIYPSLEALLVDLNGA